jgi:hypothetical protein
MNIQEVKRKINDLIKEVKVKQEISKENIAHIMPRTGQIGQISKEKGHTGWD